MEMSIRITASLAPPALPVTPRNTVFVVLLTMERTAESQRYVKAVSRNIEQDTHYNDAHPALFNTHRPHVSIPTHNSESVTEATDAIAEYGSTSELPV
jgi:hypothetical protein